MSTKKKSVQGDVLGDNAHSPKQKRLTSEEKEKLRNNWLAPAGSAEERRFLKQWASQKEISEEDRALVYAWISKPDGFEKRNEGFWRAAKRSVLGGVVYESAMERQKKLTWDEWLIACLITQGFKQREIATMVGESLSTIEKTIASIKDKIMSDFGYMVEAVKPVTVARWFLGL